MERGEAEQVEMRGIGAGEGGARGLRGRARDHGDGERARGQFRVPSRQQSESDMGFSKLELLDGFPSLRSRQKERKPVPDEASWVSSAPSEDGRACQSEAGYGGLPERCGSPEGGDGWSWDGWHSKDDVSAEHRRGGSGGEGQAVNDGAAVRVGGVAEPEAAQGKAAVAAAASAEARGNSRESERREREASASPDVKYDRDESEEHRQRSPSSSTPPPSGEQSLLCSPAMLAPARPLLLCPPLSASTSGTKPLAVRSGAGKPMLLLPDGEGGGSEGKEGDWRGEKGVLALVESSGGDVRDAARRLEVDPDLLVEFHRHLTGTGPENITSVDKVCNASLAPTVAPTSWPSALCPKP